MGLVDEADEVLGEVVDQAVRPLAGLAAVEDPRVVLDPRAEAHLAQHLHVVLRALAQAVGLEQLALGLELLAALVQLAADLRDRGLDRALLDVVVRRRPDRDVLEVVLDQLAGQRVEVLQALDLVAEQRRAVGASRRRPGRPRASRPCTRKVPRASTVSLRVYWIETSLRSSFVAVDLLAAA